MRTDKNPNNRNKTQTIHFVRLKIPTILAYTKCRPVKKNITTQYLTQVLILLFKYVQWATVVIIIIAHPIHRRIF